MPCIIHLPKKHFCLRPYLAGCAMPHLNFNNLTWCSDFWRLFVYVALKCVIKKNKKERIYDSFPKIWS